MPHQESIRETGKKNTLLTRSLSKRDLSYQPWGQSYTGPFFSWLGYLDNNREWIPSYFVRTQPGENHNKLSFSKSLVNYSSPKIHLEKPDVQHARLRDPQKDL